MTLARPADHRRPSTSPACRPTFAHGPWTPGSDFPALAAFMADVNTADGHPEILTPEEVAIEWRRTPGFEPTRDALVARGRGGLRRAPLSVDAR